jgi:hypothetical protein
MGWTSTRPVDTHLDPRGRLECFGTDVAECAVNPRSPVSNLDPFEDRWPSLPVACGSGGRAPAPSSAAPRRSPSSRCRSSRRTGSCSAPCRAPRAGRGTLGRRTARPGPSGAPARTAGSCLRPPSAAQPRPPSRAASRTCSIRRCCGSRRPSHPRGIGSPRPSGCR